MNAVVERAIIRLLTDYPKLSQTMLSSHISPYGKMYDVDWHAVLAQLVEEGRVTRTVEQSGRRTVINYQLTQRPNSGTVLNTNGRGEAC